MTDSWLNLDGSVNGSSRFLVSTVMSEEIPQNHILMSPRGNILLQYNNCSQIRCQEELSSREQRKTNGKLTD